MYILKNKTKNGYVYFLAESFIDPVTKKNSSKTVERLGTEEEIKKKIGNKDIKKWLSNYAKEKTQKQSSNKYVNIKIPTNKTIPPNENKLFNGGYLFLKKCCLELELDKICNKIQKIENLDFSLFDLLSCMIYNKFMTTNHAISTYIFSQTLIEDFDFSASDIKTAVSILYKYSTDIQKFINKKLDKCVPSEQNSIFYECLNFNNIMQKNSAVNIFTKLNDNKLITKLYYKNNGMIIGYSLIDQDDKFINIDDYIYRKYVNANLYETADSVALPDHDQKLKIFKGAKKIHNVSFANFDKKLTEWILDTKDWTSLSDLKTYDLKDLSEKILTSTETNDDLYNYVGDVFFKEREITITNTKNGKKIKENLFIIFSFEMRLSLQEQRNYYIENIKKTVETQIRKRKHLHDFYSKYNKLIKDYGVEDNANYYVFDDQQIQEQGKFDGYMAYCEEVDNKTLLTLLNISYRNKLVDYKYYNEINRELLYIPRLSVRENLNTHFLVSYLTNNIHGLLYSKLGLKYWYYQIQETLRNMCFYRVKNEGWIPQFTRSKITDDLKDAFDIDINKQFISDKDMKKLIRK